MMTSGAGQADAASPEPDGEAPSMFLTTHWSMVLAAGGADSAAARDALASLCQVYWRPLYAYARRRGYSQHDAEDLTQGLFARILDRGDVAGVHPDRGRFRSYLLAAMNHFMSDEWDKARARKRGGGKVILMDTTEAESLYLQQHVDANTPDKLFDQQWAMTVLDEVQGRLRRSYAREGKSELFDALRFSLMGDRSSAPYAELGRELGLSEGAVKAAVHRLRRRYRLCLRELIAETVAEPEEVEDELRHLLRALADRDGT